jgi:hypothetical protein
MKSTSMVALLLGLCLALSACTRTGSAPNFGPMFDRMEHAVPQVVRIGSQKSDGSHCGVDSGDNGYVERTYKPAKGLSVIEAENAIFDYFDSHGFSSNGGQFGTPDDEADGYPPNWELTSSDKWVIGTRYASDYETETNRITLRIEAQEC